MRQNFPGLLAWALLLVGFATGGVWLVTLGRSNSDAMAWPWGVAALVTFVASFAIFLAVRFAGGSDPLEPEITAEEAATYEDTRTAGEGRAATEAADAAALHRRATGEDTPGVV